jgi:hypothetical protein
MEIATARYTQAGEPTLASLKRLHTLRQNQRVTPVLIATILSDGRVSLFEPTTSTSPTRPIDLSQANRFLQAILDEATPVAARSRLQGLLQSLDTTAIPGIKNSGLFANHELRNGVPRRSDWQEACRTSQEILALREHELIAQLGYSTEGLGSHALVLTGSGIRPEAIAVMLTDREAFDANSQRFSVSPVAYGLKMAEQAGVPWLILVRGGQLRLYPARIDLGVGRKGLAETFLELDLPQLTDDNAGYLSLIFAAPALVEGGSAFQIMASSAQYAVALGARLRDKIYEDIVPRLSVAIADQLTTLGHAMNAEGLDLAYQLTLRVFFRMLFQVYAEDRKLLPYGENERYDRHALKTIAKDLFADPDQAFDSASTSLWDDLAEVWRVIDTGDRAWGVPAYNGGLFASDAELNPHGALIHDLHVSNDVIGPCLRALLLDRSDDGEFGPIDFRSLSVREFGTIYEGLLESSLGLAEVDLTLDRDGTWLPAKPADVVEARAGDVYFHNTSGQRKGTGSYFTPSFVVEHLLERALDPALDDHLERVAELIKKGDQAGAAELFFDFRVADLAMGSGHFLTSAIDHMEKKMAAFLEEDGHQIPGVTNEVILLGNAAVEAMGDIDQAPPEGSSLLRRQIARRCVYGLDINPIAVELARVSIWIHTFVRGLPMSSLDHNLVCANSLTGIGSVDEALDALVPGRRGMATLFDAPIEDALKSSEKTLLDVARLPEVDRKETQAASRAVKKAYGEARKAKLLFDAAVLRRIGQGALIKGEDPNTMSESAALEVAQNALNPLNPGHMPVLFPEVFLRENGGFDVLVGNPPWEKMHVKEDAWWSRVRPGLVALGKMERDETISHLRKSRPDIEAQFQEEIREKESIKLCLIRGPYPGVGSSHIDLYAIFAWRNFQMLRRGGYVSLVLPRSAWSGSSLGEWRKEIFSSASLTSLTLLANEKQWIFAQVDGRYVVSLSTIQKRKSELMRISGPFFSAEDFKLEPQKALPIEVAEVSRWSKNFALPNLPSPDCFDAFVQMKKSPDFVSSASKFKFTQGDFNSTTHKDRFTTGVPDEIHAVPVLNGGSINIWQPDFGKPYGKADEALVAWIRSQYLSKNPLAHSVPIDRARIAIRQITNSTNRRTVLACLIPPGSALVHGAHFIDFVEADPKREAFLLAVLCSIPFDWYARRWVELNVTFELLRSMPIPEYNPDDERQIRLIDLAGRLSAQDERFSEWASEVGVPIGKLTDDEMENSMIEIDALVADIYGLDATQLEVIFRTFHRGWAFHNRLTRTLNALRVLP